MTQDLEPIAPQRAVDLYLAQREDDASERTVQAHRYRLKHFVRWCGQELKRQKFSFTSQQTPVSGQQFDGRQTDATPEQVRQTIRAYVKSESHDVDGEVLGLWRGSDEGRKSPSEADMAFVKQLYYWCQDD